MQEKNIVLWNLYSEILDYVPHLNSEVEHTEINNNPLIAAKAASAIDTLHRRLINCNNLYVALNKNGDMNTNRKIDIQWQFSDYIMQSIIDLINVFFQQTDKMSKTEKNNFKLKNEKYPFLMDFRNMNFHAIVDSTSFNKLWYEVNCFNKEAASYTEKFISRNVNNPLTPPAGMKFISNLGQTISFVKFKNKFKKNIADDQKFNSQFEIIDSLSELYKLTENNNEKVKMSNLDYSYGFNKNEGTVFKDVNEWYAFIQLGKSIAIKINMYEFWYSIITLLMQLLLGK